MHWTETYIGRPYASDTADCGRLYYNVSREVFGYQPPPESDMERAASRLGRAAQMIDAVRLYGIPVEEPQEGDAVLMWCLGRPSHIGVYCVIGEPCVLHAMENAGQVCLHPLRALPRLQFRVEWYYRWK